MTVEEYLHADFEEECEYIELALVSWSRESWAIDPESRRSWMFDGDGPHENRGSSLTTKDGEVSVLLAEIFAELDGE